MYVAVVASGLSFLITLFDAVTLRACVFIASVFRLHYTFYRPERVTGFMAFMGELLKRHDHASDSWNVRAAHIERIRGLSQRWQRFV